jgi:predicted dehydrogenase
MINLGIISLDHPHATGNHLPALKYMGNRVKVTAIYHEDRSYAQRWLDLTGAKYYNSRDILLGESGVDAVLITSINDRHAEDSIAAANAGKDILCDKPIALNTEECVRIVEAVRQGGVKFVTTFPVRFNTSVQRVKSLIDSGKMGEIKAIMATNHGCMYEPNVPDWVLDPALNGGGCLIDHTVHVADIIRWLTGAEFETVKAESQVSALRDYVKAEDIAVLQGQMNNGMIYQIDTSWSRRKNDPVWGDVTFRIVGTKGSASLDIYNNQHLDVFVEGESVSYYPSLIVYEHGKIFDDYHAFRENGKTLVGADEIDGLRTIELVCAAYESVRKGNVVTVKHFF